MFTSLKASSLFSGGWEADFDLILNNDLAFSNWKFMSSHAMLSIPVGSTEGFPFGRSRVQVGRQLFLGPFEFALLDGVQAPLFLSKTSGIKFASGWLHPTDLSEPLGIPVVGAEFWENFFGFDTRVGLLGREAGLTERTIWGSLYREFSSWTWAPGLLLKGEIDPWQGNPQSLVEITVNPFNGLFLSGAFSYRKPRRVLANENFFLYSMLAQTSQRTWETTARYQIFEDWELSGGARWLFYGSGYSNESGNQQDLTLTWTRPSFRLSVPSFTHTQSFGGDLYDVGASYWLALTDHWALDSQAAVARYSKINGISGWAAHARAGLEWQTTRKLAMTLWGELERNHQFNLDARAIFNVRYFQ